MKNNLSVKKTMTKKLFLFIGIVFFTHISFASTPPKIFNFRIEASDPGKVYFDSDKPIVGSNVIGFYITDNSITNVTISEGQLSNHYFSVSSTFDYWDNNTIRYEGGGDIRDADNNYLIDFTLTYIENNIPEPVSTKDRYVTTSASGGGDGLSEGTAWTLNEAFSRANAGTTVWIKAGNYGNQNFELFNDGTSSNPIKYIGYKNSIGDITSNYWDYTTNTVGDFASTWNSAEMPTLTGNNASNGIAISLTKVNNVIFRNLQITNYYRGIHSYFDNSNVVFDRINGHSFGVGNNQYSTFIAVSASGEVGNKNYKIKNCIGINADVNMIALLGDGNSLIDNCKTYSDRPIPGDELDYHIVLNGNNNIIKDCSVINYNTENNTSSHGIGIAGRRRLVNNYNLITNCTAINMSEALYIRNAGCDYNVVKDSYVGNNQANYKLYRNTSGLVIWGDAKYNVFERCTVENNFRGVYFAEIVGEDFQPVQKMPSHTLIKNCVFNGVTDGIGYGFFESSPTLSMDDTNIINNTFNDVAHFINNYNVNTTNFNIINNNLTNITYFHDNWSGNTPIGTALKFENNNFYNNGNNWLISGNGNLNLNPQYISQANLRLSAASPVEITEGGKVDSRVKYDYDGKYRGNVVSIGAYQFGESTTGFVNAGEDVIICEGSEAILTATGTGDFLWNNGETTASITVSPTETTTYTVTSTDGDNTDSDDVVVTVTEAPSVTLGEDIDSCTGNEVTLTAEGNGEFLWSTGDTSASIVVNPLETTTYTVSATVECGTESLSVSDTIVVNIDTDLVVTAGDDVTSCSGSEVILTAEGTGDFLWNTGETTASITVNPTETTTYSVASSNGICTVNDDVIITIIEQPEVTLDDDLTICYGNEVTLNAVGNGNFLWSTGETTASIDINPIETTEYIVTASVNCGTEVLSVSDTIVVNVTPELTLNVSDDVAFCTAQEVTLTATSNGSILWGTGETTDSITVNPTETTTYTVTTTLGDCTLTDEITITIADQPVVDLGADVSLCSGNTATLTAEGNGAFLWSTGETGGTIDVSPTETTEYIVTASIDCGSEVLSVTDTIIVTVIPGVTLSVSDDAAICAGSEIILTADSNTNYLWSTGETTASITVSPSETTTYTVTSGSGDCALTEEVTVTVEEGPKIILEDDKTICFGESTTLTVEGVGAVLWSTGETSGSITVNPSVTTTYSVTATKNCGGNDVSVSEDITVIVSENTALSVSNDVTICSGLDTTLTAEGNGNFLWSTGETTASITVSPAETTTYTVTSGSGSCAKSEDVVVTVEQSPSVNLGEDKNICYGDYVILAVDGFGDVLWSNGATSRSLRVNPLETTTYSVSVSSCGLTVTDEIVVNVGEDVTVSAGEDKEICTGENVTLTAEGSGNFLWNTGETTQTITVSPNISTLYWVTSTIGDCSAYDETYVVVERSPTVELGDDLTICSGEEVTLIAEGAGEFLWNTGEITSSISVSPAQTTTYSVTSSSHCSSSATDEITVIVNDAVDANAGPDISIEAGDSATLTVTGGTTYLWSNGATTATIEVQPTTTTVYSVEVGNDEGSCNGTDEVTVTVEDIPLTINDGEDVTICKDDELILQATGSDNYLWNTGEMGKTITVNPAVTTRFTVSAQKNGVLETVEILVIVEDCSANKAEEFSMYPNPTTGIVNLSLPSQKEKVTIKVVSINGKLVLSKEIKADKNGVFTQINLSNFAKGVYLLKMYNDNYSETKKVLVI